ncbi:hypothetical protein ABZ845_29075 [Streptomyces sp. NPDC047022]|uniref:hypothetical protein n=1 Tax=Streptomyces sp. NPDC047022 TaxID=3155737 RepID=UPI0033C62345
MIARLSRSDGLRGAVAAVRAAAVVVPLAVLAGVGRLDLGAAGSFGAYLMVAAFSSLSSRPHVPVLFAGAVELGVWSAAGALAAPNPWALAAGTAVVASVQGLWEVAGGPLRMASAMSALAFLLASINLSPGTRWWEYAVGFATGALWQAAVIALTGRGPGRRPPPVRRVRGPGPARARPMRSHSR